MKKNIFTILFNLIICIPVIYSQNTRYVSTSGNNSNSGLTELTAYSTIQFAIDQSVNGDSVIVFPGTYYENIIYNGKNIILTSLFSRNRDTSFISSTVIDGGAIGTHSVVRVHNGEVSAQLKGMTIQNGLTVVGNGGAAGINISGSSLEMDYIIIQNNISTNAPGAINLYFANKASIITNSIIRNNQSGTVSGVGGAIYTWNSNIHIRNCEIYGNKANDISAICFHQGSQNSSNFPIVNTLIYNNSSTTRSIYSEDGLTLINCVVADNIGYIGINGSSNIYNTVIGRNNDIFNLGTLTIKNSIIESGLGSITSLLPQFLVQANNYFQSAEFVDESNYDYRLKNYSVGIGSAINSMTINGNNYFAPNLDLNNDIRPNPTGSQTDIGVFENDLGISSNAPPTIQLLNYTSINEDTPTLISLNGLSDGDLKLDQVLSINAISSNTSLIPNPLVNYSQGQNTGTLFITPTTNASGQSTITLIIKDNGGTANGGLDSMKISFVVNVNPINDIPETIDDNGITNEDVSTVINILANDTDVDGALDLTSIDLDQNVLGIQNSVATLSGTWTVNTTSGELTYMPALNYFGTTTISYSILDNEGLMSNISSVSIIVYSINDIPVASADNGITNEDNSVTINLVSNDSDIDGTLDLSTIDLDQAIAGIQQTLTTSQGNWTVDVTSGILSYTPTSNYNGTATINYTIKDDSSAVSPLTLVSVVVQSINDAPLTQSDNVVTNEDFAVTISILSNDTDIDGALDLTSIDLDQNVLGIQNSVATLSGTWTVNTTSGELTYMPALNYFGTTTISYSILDNEGLMSNISSVSIIVYSINDIPVASADNGITNEDNSVTINLVSNDSDIDGTLDLSTIDLDQAIAGIQQTLTTSQGNWTVDVTSGILSYTPTSNYNGTATINYTIKDDSSAVSNISLISFIVKPMNDSPTAINIDNSTIDENKVGVIGVFTTNDIDIGENFIYQLVTGIGDADNSLFSISSNQLLNVSSFDFERQNSYSIRIRTTDDSLTFFEKIVNIQILNVNDIHIQEVITNTLCTGSNSSGTISITVDQFNGIPTFAWSGPNGFLSSNQNISGLDAGNYSLSVTDNYDTQLATYSLGVKPVYNDLELCYVSSDLNNPTKNRVFFKNPGIYNIQYYQVLRESSVGGMYDLMGQVKSSDSSYLDVASNNSSLSYKYEVRAVDSCGNFSSESPSHRTILLQANLGLGNTVNLSWNSYEGTSYSTYSVFRSVNGGQFELLISLPISNTTFNDGTADVSSNTYKYFVAISVNACDFTKISNQIRSNQKIIGNASLNELSNELIQLYPNPTTDIINIKIPNELELKSVALMDQAGKIIRVMTNDVIHISDLQNGIYWLRINLISGQSIQKMITKI